MRRPLARLVGGFAVFRFPRKRPAQAQVADPRADALRQRLAEARELA
jgi:hypothetical protein